MPARTPNAPLLRGTLELILLQTLAHRPLHGYAIARRIEQETDDALSVEEGSMYPALHRLEDQGLVSARWSVNERGRRARVYAITTNGRARLADHKKDWAQFAKAISRLVGAK